MSFAELFLIGTHSYDSHCKTKGQGSSLTSAYPQLYCSEGNMRRNYSFRTTTVIGRCWFITPLMPKLQRVILGWDWKEWLWFLCIYPRTSDCLSVLSEFLSPLGWASLSKALRGWEWNKLKFLFSFFHKRRVEIGERLLPIPGWNCVWYWLIM